MKAVTVPILLITIPVASIVPMGSQEKFYKWVKNA